MLQRETLPDHDRPCDIRRVRRRGLRVHKRGRLLVGLCEIVRRQTATRCQTVSQGNGRPIRIREYSRRFAPPTIVLGAKQFKLTAPLFVNFYTV